MKIRNPKSRFDLKIKNSDLVLEIGGGHNPHPRANYVVDKYIDDNTHRSGDIKTFNHQLFIEADGENLPFKDNFFDYVICCHVLEHVPNPDKFLKEMMRVAKRGYIEVPSLVGEFLAPKTSHTWVSLEVEQQLAVVRKSKLGIDKPTHDFGDLFLYHFNKHSLPFKLLKKNCPDLFSVRIEWENEFSYTIEPKEEEILSYFNTPWDDSKIKEMFPPTNKLTEIKNLYSALINLSRDYALSYLKRRFNTSWLSFKRYDKPLQTNQPAY